MRTKTWAVALLLGLTSAPAAFADLYTAAAAVEKQDFARAFELYRKWPRWAGSKARRTWPCRTSTAKA
jgi:hypothetical protein